MKIRQLIIIQLMIISVFACGNNIDSKDSDNSNNKSQKNNIQNNISKNKTKIEDKNMNNNKSIKIIVKNEVFEAELENTQTAQEFYEMLPMELDMEDVNKNEKFFRLPKTLTQKNINPNTINNGDIMLYGSNGLVIFYETFSTVYSYTPLGKIKNTGNLKKTLGLGNVKIKFEK